MTKDRGSGLMGASSGLVVRPVVYHDDFIMVAGFVQDFLDPSDY
jgi:hypothetical protein